MTAVMNHLRNSLAQKLQNDMSAFIEASTMSMWKTRSDQIHSMQAVGETGKSIRFVLETDILNFQILGRSGDTPAWTKICDITQIIEYTADDPELARQLEIQLDAIEGERKLCQTQLLHAISTERERAEATMVEQLGQFQREFRVILAEFQSLGARELSAIRDRKKQTIRAG